MFYRVELEIDPDVEHPIGCEDIPGWQGIFRPGGFYWDLLERSAQDYEACSRLRQYWYEEIPWVQLPPTDKGLNYQFWFTELGYKKFEKVADLFLLALSHMPEAKDIRVLKRNFPQNAVLYEDEYQIAVAG